MTIEQVDVLWIEGHGSYTLQEMIDLSGLPETVLRALTGHGALPARQSATTVVFEAESVSLARAARRLRDHFELDEDGLAVAVTLLRRVRTLEAQLVEVRGSR